MDEHKHEKSGIPAMVWVGLALIILGILAGVYLSPTLEPWVNPSRATLFQNTQRVSAQNALLKSQVDCLVNGITLNHGKATLTQCT